MPLTASPYPRIGAAAAACSNDILRSMMMGGLLARSTCHRPSELLTSGPRVVRTSD